jgi:hypothetical protein
MRGFFASLMIFAGSALAGFVVVSASGAESPTQSSSSVGGVEVSGHETGGEDFATAEPTPPDTTPSAPAPPAPAPKRPPRPVTSIPT